MTTTTDEKSEPKRVRPFADFLREQNRGEEHAKASAALQELVNAVTDTGKKGSVTIKVDVEPMKGTDGAMLTTVTVTSKLPALPVRAAVFYADADGNLTREDPRQPTFEGLRDAGGTDTPVREVPASGDVRDAR